MDDLQFVSNIFSDDMLAGGGPGDDKIRWMETFEDPLTDSYDGSWEVNYQGMYREHTSFKSYTVKFMVGTVDFRCYARAYCRKLE